MQNSIETLGAKDHAEAIAIFPAQVIAPPPLGVAAHIAQHLRRAATDLDAGSFAIWVATSVSGTREAA